MPANGPRAGSLQRVVGASLLLGLLTLGIRARTVAFAAPLTHGAGLAGVFLALLAALTAAVLVGSFLWRLRFWRRKRGDEVQHVVEIPRSSWERWQTLTAMVIVLAVPAVLVWAALRLVRQTGRQTGATPASPSTSPSPTPSPATTGGHSAPQTVPSWLPLSIVVLVLIIVAVVVAVVVARLKTKRTTLKEYARGAPSGPTASEPAAAQVPAAAEGLADPRGAIVAAYRTFEQRAASRGVSVTPPQTAAQIARHAVDSEVGDSQVIADLTDLFHRARYSSGLLEEADRDRAARLLDRLPEDGRPPS